MPQPIDRAAAADHQQRCRDTCAVGPVVLRLAARLAQDVERDVLGPRGVTAGALREIVKAPDDGVVDFLDRVLVAARHACDERRKPLRLRGRHTARPRARWSQETHRDKLRHEPSAAPARTRSWCRTGWVARRRERMTSRRCRSRKRRKTDRTAMRKRVRAPRAHGRASRRRRNRRTASPESAAIRS